MKAFLNQEEVGDMLGLDAAGIKDLVRRDELREFRDAGKIFFKTEDAQEYARKHPCELIDQRDFTTDGKTDWTAYQNARTENGEQCYNCSAPITRFTGKPTVCSECEDIVKPEELCHSDLVRCPKCCQTFNPGESDCHELYGDGEHEICCEECNHTFEISTHVSYTFVSPPLSGARPASPPIKED